MKEQLIELWCKATKEKELEEYTEDTRNLYDYTMKIVECIKDTKESSDAIIIEQKEEIERLNNIINELEKYSENMIVDYNEAIEEAVDNIDRFNLLGARSSYREISNKIKELKGSDKE